MSQMGHLRHFLPAPVTSAVTPKADNRLRCNILRSGPTAVMGGVSLSLHQWLGDFVGVLDEKLRDRAQRAVFQGDDTNWHAGHGQFNRQDLQLWMEIAKF